MKSQSQAELINHDVFHHIFIALNNELKQNWFKKTNKLLNIYQCDLKTTKNDKPVFGEKINCSLLSVFSLARVIPKTV